MKRIGLLSDTHAYWDDRYMDYFTPCDEIWHAGDIGNLELAERLKAIRPLVAVHGNIDGYDVRCHYPEVMQWKCEEVDVLMKHIGGYPGNYDRSVVDTIRNSTPQLFISGHSHILKVKFDKTLNLLHINPGAAGVQGWQKVRTIVRFTIDGKYIKDLEIVEMK